MPVVTVMKRPHHAWDQMDFFVDAITPQGDMFLRVCQASSEKYALAVYDIAMRDLKPPLIILLSHGTRILRRSDQL